jgi:hypothetical protein
MIFGMCEQCAAPVTADGWTCDCWIKAALLRHGDHTKDCSTREYHENQWGGFQGLACNCGWNELKNSIQAGGN